MSHMPLVRFPIFETPCYSIENLYVSLKVFRDILKNEFHLSEVSDSSFQICVEIFEKRQQEFHEAVCLFNAWYACLIEIRNREGNQTGVSLDEKLPKGMIEISLNAIKQNYDIDQIKNRFPHATEVEPSHLQVKVGEFTSCEQRKEFRGKYELRFLIRIIQLLLKDANIDQTVLKEKNQICIWRW